MTDAFRALTSPAPQVTQRLRTQSSTSAGESILRLSLAKLSPAGLPAGPPSGPPVTKAQTGSAVRVLSPSTSESRAPIREETPDSTGKSVRVQNARSDRSFHQC